MIPPPPPLPTLVKTRTSQSRVPPIPQRAAIPFNYGPTPPVQETGYEPDQNSQVSLFHGLPQTQQKVQNRGWNFSNGGV